MILIVAFFLPAVLFLIYGLPVLRKEGIKSVFPGSFFPKVYLPPKAPGQVFLQNNFAYYKALSPKAKAKFFKRFGYLLHNKEIKGAEGFEVTDEMRYYIFACWVQVTFGLDKYKMPNYEEVILYRSRFYSGRVGSEVKGLTTSTMLYFSWEDFEAGYKNPEDNYNVGIHELSHAFLVSTFKGGDFDIGFSSYIDQWFEATKVEFANIADGLPSYLRNYGGTNNYEFFSVCMETFFENPQMLKEKLPDIFYHLCYLLNQNPLNTTGDYAFDARGGVGVNTAIPLPDKAVRSLKYTGFHWSYLIPMASIALFIFSLKIYFITFITLPELMAIFIAGISVGFIKYIRNRLLVFFPPPMARLFLVGVFGFGLINLLLILNYSVPTSESKTETHKITSYNNFRRMGTKSSRGHAATEFYFENDELDGLGEIRTVEGHTTIEPGHAYVMDINYHYGLLGVKVFENNKVRELGTE